MVTPGAKREAVAHAREHHGVSERRACALVGVSRRVIRYEPTRPDDGALRLHCYPTSDRSGLEFSALLRSGGLVSPAEFASMIGGIFPIALCGRSSL